MEVIDLTSNQPCLRKKKKVSDWVSPSFMDTTSNTMKASSTKRKFLRHKSCDISKQPPDSGQTWLQRYAPVTEDELAVHKKKVLEVDSWLDSQHSHKKSGAPILLLTGPSGCGKTATLMVVARKHGIQVEEWINPLTTPFNVTKQAGLKYESQNVQFEEFLFRCGKYPSLVLNVNNKSTVKPQTEGSQKLVLLEELPQYIYQDPPCFKDILRKYRLTQRRPLVVILSDGSSMDSVKRQLISREFQYSAGITQIAFNAISATLMSKTLSRIAQLERRNLGKEELSMLSGACAGDIRAAINALQFSSQSEALTVKSLKSSSSKKVKGVALGGKDTTLILFRALGKILYCKRDGDAKASKCSDSKTFRDPLLIQPEEVIDQCCLSGKAFGLFLHHNYMPFFEHNPVEDLSTAADYFSLADLMNSPLTSSDPSSGAGVVLDRYEGILAARGLIYSNSMRATADLCSKATGSWRPLHKPSWYQVSKKQQENMVNVSCSFWKLRQPPQELLCTTLPYLLHLRAQHSCDPVQRMLLNDVVALPKWKLFKSSADNRVGEQLAGDDSLELTEQAENPVGKVTAEEETPGAVDEAIEIEEFSD